MSLENDIFNIGQVMLKLIKNDEDTEDILPICEQVYCQTLYEERGLFYKLQKTMRILKEEDL